MGSWLRMRPQENGHRSEMRWMSLTNPPQVEIQISELSQFGFNAHRFAVRDLICERHTCVLISRGQIILKPGCRQYGLGSVGGGPGMLPAYERHTHTLRFGPRLLPTNTATVESAP